MTVELPVLARPRFSIAADNYFVHSDAHVLPLPLPLPLPQSVLSSPRLATVVSCAESIIHAQWLSETLAQFLETDDVICDAFFDLLFIIPANPGYHLALHDDTEEWCLVKGITIIISQEDECQIPPGPYFVEQGSLFQISKLYPDTQEAFLFGTIPSKDPRGRDPTHKSLDLCHRRFQLIAVPSRLYSPATPELPMNGVRLAVKDNIDLAGLPTCLSSRALEQLGEVPEGSAKVIQILMALGAVVVGKTKTSQFANIENPTADWVDIHAPFNPRGDGYLSPSYSSAGSSTAIAAYDWLDVGLGTDTGGSIREPANACGLFAHRFTAGSISLDGVFPLAESLDAFGVVSRKLNLVKKVVKVLLAQPNKTTPVKDDSLRVISLQDFQYKDNSDAAGVFEKFFTLLEQYLGFKRVAMTLTAVWESQNPAGHSSISDFLEIEKTLPALKDLDLWLNTARFRQKYADEYGRALYVNPGIELSWEYGRRLSQGDKDKALEKQRTFKTWFLNTVLNSGIDSFSIVVLPLSTGLPRYRDLYLGKPARRPFKFHQNFIGTLAGCPELVIPIGQTSYQSKFSGKVEQMPAMATFLGPPGSDEQLCNLAVEFLTSQGLPLTVKTGSVLW